MKNKKTFLMVLIVILYFSIIVTVTNGFGAGDSVGDSDMVLVKYNSSGVQQWDRTWGGIDDDRGWGVVVDSSDNVYLSGLTHSFGAGENDMVLVKYDSSGVQQWNRTWGGIDEDGGSLTAVDSSDNVYLAGYTSKREEEPPPISGYDLLLFISVIGVITAITAIFLNKKYNK